MSTVGGGGNWHNMYGPDFLAQLNADQDWISVEALWRWGATTDLPALADVMARSGSNDLAMLLAYELQAARRVDHLPDLPKVLHTHTPKVGPEAARNVLNLLNNEEKPLDATYAQNAHLIVSWLMNQPGDPLGDLAIEIAQGGHPFSDSPEPLDAAIARIARNAKLGARLIKELVAAPDKWATGDGWTRTASMVGRSGRNPKGRAELVRELTSALLALPPHEAVTVPAEFAVLMERHAANDLLSTLQVEQQTDTPGVNAALTALASFKQSAARDDLITAIACRQAVLWSLHRPALLTGGSADDWTRLLSRWGVPGHAPLYELAAVIGAAPHGSDLAALRCAIVHGIEAGDQTSSLASEIVRRLATPEEGADPVMRQAVDSIPWGLTADNDRLRYLSSVIEQAFDPEMCAEIVVAAYRSNLITADATAAMLPQTSWSASLVSLPAGPSRAMLTAALHAMFSAEEIEAPLSEVMTGSNDTLDVIEAVATRNPQLAFESFDETRWHALDANARDHLVQLLELHATLDQAGLLDLIAGDSDGSNSDRRARVGRRWADLTQPHSVIPPGVFTLLDSARPALNEAFAQIAATVQPRDETTLLRLHDKRVSGGQTGIAAQEALDIIAAGTVDSMKVMSGPTRVEQGPALLRILGIAASPESFDTLISHVGSSAISDDLRLRQAAAAAIQAFVDTTKLDAAQLGALGTVTNTEPDTDASAHLRDALTAARMGEDAAILVLYEFLGLSPSAVPEPPGELYGDQKHRLLTALKRLVVHRELGAVGWDGYVEQMDLVAEALVRAAYLKFGNSEPMKAEIKENGTKPKYGALVKALAPVKGFDAPSIHLQTLHDMRSQRTGAHHTDNPLDQTAVNAAENALATAAQTIITRLQSNGTHLRSVATDV